jgi:hypothetical protein
MRAWMMRLGMMLLAGTLFGALLGCGHDPNHDIDREQARAAANRVHKPPPAGEKRVEGAGG